MFSAKTVKAGVFIDYECSKVVPIQEGVFIPYDRGRGPNMRDLRDFLNKYYPGLYGPEGCFPEGYIDLPYCDYLEATKRNLLAREKQSSNSDSQESE